MASREELIAKMKPLFGNTGGFDSWFSQEMPDEAVDRLSSLEQERLSLAQFNQLLLLSHEAGMAPAFYRYYWLSKPNHTYDVASVPGFSEAWTRENGIASLDHLKWGLYRFFIDALLYFGNVRTAYRTLRQLNDEEIERFFAEKRFDSREMQLRGPALALSQIRKDRRYLISEMACKTMGVVDEGQPDLRDALLKAYRAATQSGITRVKIKDLLGGTYLDKNYTDRQEMLRFSADEILEQEVESEADIEAKFGSIADEFNTARQAALNNTRQYLSMAHDLDVYVATSMRTRQDFRSMADFCETVFHDERLRRLHVRYFDPTMSAADGHEDKGLIECLMVKCSKALVYCAGTKDSYGKDAEAAMALSLGKPVIFFCDEEHKSKFFKDVHPLSRLIHFETGVPMGAMVATSPPQVAELLHRVFENKMAYAIEQPKDGYLRLVENLTGCVVRIQTNNKLLRETFWNYYHNRR